MSTLQSIHDNLHRDKQALSEAQAESATAEAEFGHREEQVRRLKIDVANAKASALCRLARAA